MAVASPLHRARRGRRWQWSRRPATARPKEVPLAIQKGTEEAKKNLFDVALAGSTITHLIIGINSAGRG